MAFVTKTLDSRFRGNDEIGIARAPDVAIDVGSYTVRAVRALAAMRRGNRGRHELPRFINSLACTILWRSELRNVLTAYLRRDLLTRAQIVGILSFADRAFAEREHIVPDELVLDVVASSALTAYDAELVALAIALSVPLVTADKAVLKAFPDRALTMEAFLELRQDSA